MKLILKEDPREWRKAGWMSCGGLTVASSLLRWRHVLSTPVWLVILAVLVSVAVAVAVRPRLARGYYRFTTKLGFALSKLLGIIVLNAVFLVIFVPAGLIMRLFGKDPLLLRRPKNESSLWRNAPAPTSLDKMY